jgi:hypothetical protein
LIGEAMLGTTEVKKSNQGANPKSRYNRFRGSFFGTFLEKQKSTAFYNTVMKIYIYK